MGPKHNDAELYLRIAKKFAIDLPDEKDRVLALKWLKFLQDSIELAEKRIKIHVTQLLLICLQRKRLVGPFIDPPDPKKKLLEYGWLYQPADIARLILKSEFERIGKTPYSLDLSGDLCEYVATQEIPQFGAHFFYAFSPEQIRHWDNVNTALIPKGFLAMTTTESPDSSYLASAIEQAALEKKRAKVVVPEHAKKKGQFTGICMLDPETGALQEEFVKEVPSVDAVSTDLLQRAVKGGMLGAHELDLPDDIKQEISRAGKAGEKSSGRTDSRQADNFYEPIIETIEVTAGDETTKTRRKMKNVKTRSQKKRTKKAFEAIAEEEDSSEAKAKTEQEEKENEERRQQLIAMMPKHLRKRFEKRKAKLKTPDVFRKDVKYKKIFKPEEFGLSKDEKFEPAIDVFENLQYEPYKSFRKLVWIYPNMPSQRWNLDSSQRRTSDAASTPKDKRIQDDVEASFERSLKKRLDKRATEPQTDLQTDARRNALEKLNRLKAIQPRRIVFDEIDIQPEPEEVKFERFVFSDFPDEDKTPSILEDEDMTVEDMFGEDQVAPVSFLKPPPPIDQLEKAEILLDTEMETDDVFGDAQLAEPSIIFKEVTVEGERQVAPADPNAPLREGGIRMGKRVIHISGHKPMKQHFVEQYGDVVFDETLEALDLGPDGQSYTPPMNEELLNKYLDGKLKQLKPGEQPPRVYGPWAESFRKQIERLERGEDPDSFPDEEAAKYQFPHDSDKSILSGSQMDITGQFDKDKIAIPSPVQEAELRRQSDVFNKLKDTFEVKKARRINKALQEQEDYDQDLLEPYIFESLPDDRATLLDASVTDAGLGKALLDAPKTPPKRNLLESFERQLDESLKYFTASDSLPGLQQNASHKRVFLDDDFLNRRIQDGQVPAEDSILEDDQLATDDMFASDKVVEPPPISKIAPPAKRSSPKPASPVRHSHLYLPGGRYKSKIEDILPFGYLSEEEFPSDKYLEEDFVLSGAESSVNEITPPSLASGAKESMITSGHDKSRTQTFDEYDEFKTAFDVLLDEEMTIDDVFGENQIMSPSEMRQISPTTAALAKSIRQSIDTQKFINKYRQKRGLPPEETTSLPFDGVSLYVDARESLLDPIVQQPTKEQFPGIMDEPILEDQLQEPLVESRRNQTQKDPFASFEEQVMDDILNERAMQLDPTILSDREMTGDFLAEDQLAEPLPIKAIPPPPPKRSQPTFTSTPLRHSHLFLLQPPRKPPPPVIPEEMIEDIPEPEMDPVLQEDFLELSGDNAKLLSALFDGDIPSSMTDGFSGVLPDVSPREGDDSGLGQIMERFYKLKDLVKHDAHKSSPLEGEDPFDAGIIPEDQLETSDVFGDGQVLSPKSAYISPTQIILNRSAKATQDLLALKNKLRKIQKLSPIENRLTTGPIDQLKQAAEALSHIMAELLAQEPPPDSSRVKDLFEEFEKGLDASLRRKEQQALAQEGLDEYEISPLFGEGEIAEPPPLKNIPMLPQQLTRMESTSKASPLLTPRSPKTPSPRRPPLPRPPYRVKRYKSRIEDILPLEEIQEQTFPSADESILEYQPSPNIEDIQELGFISDSDLPPYEPLADEEGDDILEAEDMPIDDMFGEGRVISPGQVAMSPTEFALARSLQASHDYAKLKNKYRRLRGLPPVEENIPTHYVRKLFDQMSNLLEPVRRHSLPPEPFGLMDEPVIEEQTIPPLVSSPKKKDPFAQYERQLEKELYPSPPAPEQSLLYEDDIVDMFDEEMVDQPPPLKQIPMPSPKPSPVISPYTPKTPSPPPRKPITFSHLYHIGPIYKTPAPPPPPSGPLLYHDPQLMDETPPISFQDHSIYYTPASLPGDTQLSAPAVPQFFIPTINVQPPTPEDQANVALRPATKSPSQRMKTSSQSPELASPLTPETAYSPITFDFQDEIGPPLLQEESPELIKFREVAPGYFEPYQDKDRQQFADRQKKILANKFGVSPDAITDEMLETFSPPPFSESPRSPAIGKAGRRISVNVTPKRPALDALTPKPRQLFPADRPSLNMSPAERIKAIIDRLPRPEVTTLPKKSGFSPTQFVTRMLPPREDLLELEEFPHDHDAFADVELGDLAHATYIPTEQELREAEEIERKRQEQYKTPPDFMYTHVATRSPHQVDVSPIGVTDVLPHEEGFKWLDNYMPFEQQVRGQKRTQREQSPMPPQKKRPPKPRQQKSSASTSNRTESPPPPPSTAARHPEQNTNNNAEQIAAQQSWKAQVRPQPKKMTPHVSRVHSGPISQQPAPRRRVSQTPLSSGRALTSRPSRQTSEQRVMPSASKSVPRPPSQVASVLRSSQPRQPRSSMAVADTRKTRAPTPHKNIPSGPILTRSSPKATRPADAVSARKGMPAARTPSTRVLRSQPRPPTRTVASGRSPKPQPADSRAAPSALRRQMPASWAYQTLVEGARTQSPSPSVISSTSQAPKVRARIAVPVARPSLSHIARPVPINAGSRASQPMMSRNQISRAAPAPPQRRVIPRSSRMSRLAVPREAVGRVVDRGGRHKAGAIEGSSRTMTTPEGTIPTQTCSAKKRLDVLLGATADLRITKTKSPTVQTLLKTSTISRPTGLPKPRLQGVIEPPPETEPDDSVAFDRRTIRQSLTVQAVGENSVIRKQSTIQMQHDENSKGATMIKTNISQTLRPGETKKTESKFAIRTNR